MQSITGQLTPELREKLGSQQVSTADAFPVNTYRDLMQHVARLAYGNKDNLLFYRGQSEDFRNKAGASTFYPSIYRGDRLTRAELDERFDILTSASKRLSEAFQREKIEGAKEVFQRKLIQWSILQHYEVCPTPLLDFTQSLRVACSFALINASAEKSYVFVFGLPYFTNRISTNSEQELVNIRLLSICPPEALRPYYQEGYLAGTEEVTNEYFSKDDLDFNRRLIAKFQISRSNEFWNDGSTAIPREALYPDHDRIEVLCSNIRETVGTTIQPSELGIFLHDWAAIESLLFSLARKHANRVYSMKEALRILEQSGVLPRELTKELNALRESRNAAVHTPWKLKSGELSSSIRVARMLLNKLKRNN